MSELTLQFSRNLGEENTVLLFSAEELDGMPSNFLEGLEKVVQMYISFLVIVPIHV